MVLRIFRMIPKLLLSGVLCVLVGCGGSREGFQPLSPKTARLTGIGHQAFLLQSSLGTKILTNPFAPGSVPHRMPMNLTPDVLLISHENRTANFTRAIENFPVVLRSSVGMGTHNAGGIRIRGRSTFPDPQNPDIMEMNLVFSWLVDGMRFCFLGDLASPLSPEDLAGTAPCDIVFLPVGGRLGPADRATVLTQLRPKLIVPMGSRSAIASWASAYPRVHRVQGQSILLNASVLPAEPVAIVFATP